MRSTTISGVEVFPARIDPERATVADVEKAWGVTYGNPIKLEEVCHTPSGEPVYRASYIKYADRFRASVDPASSGLPHDNTLAVFVRDLNAVNPSAHARPISSGLVVSSSGKISR